MSNVTQFSSLYFNGDYLNLGMGSDLNYDPKSAFCLPLSI